MDLLQKIQKQVQDKLLANVNEGVERYPLPSNILILKNTNENIILSLGKSDKKFLILSDFPIHEENISEGFLSIIANNKGLIVNLLEKLGIIDDAYFAYTLSNYIPSPLISNTLSEHVNPKLYETVIKLKPHAIFCFGHRSLLSLSTISRSPIAVPLNENQELSLFQYENSVARLFYLSSIKDLLSFPIWRKQVWQVLHTFYKDNSQLLS
ncbi:hypothetical protein [Fluviispira multicolorata]|uniref:Uncharacterized protein n=1 Tax=Fluviispira multicolorata TaxID=2654512 RepID=A0A833JE00_9BACT|nr:hypothetical protein [Fluviispira multicolorata]KAB8032165.1 hypothetical protein GCL57_05830 [Fluviispira multicolorata]